MDRERRVRAYGVSTVSLGGADAALGGEADLPPCFEDDERHGVGQIDAAILCAHRNEQTILRSRQVLRRLRQAASLGSEHRHISTAILHIAVAPPSAGLDR